MSNLPKKYEEIVSCWVEDDCGAVHVKVISLPNNDPVELSSKEVKEFAYRLLELAEKVE